MILCDSNVIVDLLEDSSWAPWVSDQMEALSAEHDFAINPIIYAELSIPYGSIDSLELALASRELVRLDLPWEAAFFAGKAFADYRRRGGPRTSPIPDFYIGAHARVSGLTLLTRDRTRYQTYFPEIPVVSPN